MGNSPELIVASLPIHHHLFHPGELAPVSGIYRALHREHRADHRVMIIQGDEFPLCRVCQQQVCFELAEGADYATHDWDFAGPNLRLVK